MDFKVKEYDYNKKIANQTVEALGKVKSEKYFPIFIEDSKEYIFKPLSKTKPFLTPLFAYSEVYWSNLIKEYFDGNTPLYSLGICHGYSKQVPKYNDKGTVVPKINQKGEKLVNLLEFFIDNPDEKVNIENYVNYCGVFYDYTDILKSDFFKNNPELANQLAYQILISILKGDINYHYENVSIIYEDNEPVSIAPMIDHEFSVMFYCLDSLYDHIFYYNKLLSGINMEVTEDDHTRAINITKNLDYIIDNYREVAERFLENLKKLKNDLKYNPIRFKDEGFMEPFNSFEFMAGQARYKENDEQKAKFIEEKIDRNEIDLSKFSKSLNREVLNIISSLEKTITKKLKGKVKHI